MKCMDIGKRIGGGNESGKSGEGESRGGAMMTIM